MNDKPTIDDLLDTYYDRIKQGDELITSIQKDTKQQIERMIIEAKIEGRIEAGKHFRGYMISTSPFIEKVLNPYLTEQRRLMKLQAQLAKETTS